MIDQTGRGGSGMDLWGFSLHFWERVFFGASLIAALAGGLSVFAAFVAGIVGYQVTDRWQKDADSRISAGQAETAKANENAAIANERAGSANERAAALEKDAARARLETQQLKEKLAWRELSEATARKLLQELSTHKGAVQVQYVANDPEAFAFALQLTRVFKEAGWKAGMFSLTHPSVLMVGFFVAPHGAKPEITNLVRSAFNASGIPYAEERTAAGGWIMGDPADARDGAIIIVGAKPRPELKSQK